MHLYRIIYYPNGLLECERMESDELILARYKPLFANGLTFTSELPFHPDVSVKWTGMAEGQAMVSLFSHNKLYLSGVLAAGTDPEGDDEVLKMFRDAMEANSLFKDVARGKAEPLKAIATRPERPLLACVVWPILSAERLAEVGGLDVLLAQTFLRMIRH